MIMNYELLVEDVKNASKEDLKKLFFKVCEESNKRFDQINKDYEKRMNEAIAIHEKETLILSQFLIGTVLRVFR